MDPKDQSTPVPSTSKVCSALRYRNIDPLAQRHEYIGGFPHDVIFLVSDIFLF